VPERPRIVSGSFPWGGCRAPWRNSCWPSAVRGIAPGGTARTSGWVRATGRATGRRLAAWTCDPSPPRSCGRWTPVSAGPRGRARGAASRQRPASGQPARSGPVRRPRPAHLAAGQEGPGGRGAATRPRPAFVSGNLVNLDVETSAGVPDSKIAKWSKVSESSANLVRSTTPSRARWRGGPSRPADGA